MSLESKQYRLKCYKVDDEPHSGWVVTGGSRSKGKRWRKVFSTKDEAEDFYKRTVERMRLDADSEQGSIATGNTGGISEALATRQSEQASLTDESGDRRRHRVRRTVQMHPLRLSRMIIVLCVVVTGGLISFHNSIQNWFTGTQANGLIDCGFEEDPRSKLWETSGDGAAWADAEKASGSHSIMVRSDSWMSPVLRSKPLQWYMLKFRSKASKTPSNSGGIAYGQCLITFHDKFGKRYPFEFPASVMPSQKWQAHDLRFRAHTVPDAGGVLQAAGMRVNFVPIGGRAFFVDDVVLEETTAPEVARWADQTYSALPAQLQYQPPVGRWERIPATIQKLRDGQRLRVVFVGDEHHLDLANAPIDVFLQELFHGPLPEVLASTRPDTDTADFRESVEECITRLVPDLMVLNVGTSGSDLEDLRKIVEAVRDSDLQSGHRTEIMVVTRGWSPARTGYFLRQDMDALDQDIEDPSLIPKDYRGPLLLLAAELRLEFLDLTGAVSGFIYGPAKRNGIGPPTTANGAPYYFWMRNDSFPNEAGRQIIGRIFQAYFAPFGRRGSATP